VGGARALKSTPHHDEEHLMPTDPIRLRGEQAIRDFYDAFSASDFDTMTRMLHPQCELEFPGSSFPNRVQGRDAIIGLFQGVQAGFGGSLRFHNQWAMHQPRADAGDLIAVYWYTTGRTATGGAYLNRGVAWYRLEDGLVRDFRDFFDTEIVSAFFPGGQPATDFARANALVDRLLPFTPAEAVQRVKSLRAGAN
jgi:ketosteroid isomerase-like protein